MQVEALTVMKIIKHCSSAFPSTVTGSLVGMDVAGTLEVTNSFPFPTPDASSLDVQPSSSSLHDLAANAPRAKSNVTYQAEMVKYLREVNIDANNVGWYTATSMGNFFNSSLIENQAFYQRGLNERTVALVYDVSRSVQGALSLRAFRLSPVFLAALKDNKFTVDALQKSGLRYQDILLELPVTVHNSHLLTTFLHQLPAPPPKADLPLPVSLRDLDREAASAHAAALHPNTDTLDLSIDPFLEKTCDLLLDTIENHHTELNNHQYYQRSLAREQAKITAWQTKRKAENVTRAAAKQPALPEDEWQKLFKLPQEPSRLELMLNSGQVEQYAKQVDGFTAGVSGKMFAVKGNLLREE